MTQVELAKNALLGRPCADCTNSSTCRNKWVIIDDDPTGVLKGEPVCVDWTLEIQDDEMKRMEIEYFKDYK